MISSFFAHHYYYLLVFLLIMGFVAGFVDAIAGGGGLISVPALLITDMPIALVFGTNKLQSTIGTATATYNYYRNGLINLKTAYSGLIFGFFGACVGSIIVNHVSNQFMEYVVPVLMILVFLFNLLNKKLGVEPRHKKMQEVTFFPLFGFILSFYDAFFGPGTGNFWIIAIVYFLGYTFINASGYAKMLNLKSNLFALLIFLYYGNVNFIYGLVMTIGSTLGGYLGAKTAVLKGSRIIRPLFMLVILVNIVVSIVTIFHQAP